MIHGILIFFHSVACILLITVILMQAGRKGGLTDGFASAESMFGAKTNAFMVRTTVVMLAVFMVTSLSLAYVTAKKDQSIMRGARIVGQPVKDKSAVATSATTPVTTPMTPGKPASGPAPVAATEPAVKVVPTPKAETLPATAAEPTPQAQTEQTQP